MCDKKQTILNSKKQKTWRGDSNEDWKIKSNTEAGHMLGREEPQSITT